MVSQQRQEPIPPGSAQLYCTVAFLYTRNSNQNCSLPKTSYYLFTDNRDVRNNFRPAGEVLMQTWEPHVM